MDKKFGPTWHCCIGEGFGYDITYNTRNMLMIYYGEVSIFILFLRIITQKFYTIADMKKTEM